MPDIEPDCRVRLIDELVRYHNVVDALMTADAKQPPDDEDDARRAVLKNLRVWEGSGEDDESPSGLPPHLVTGLALASEIGKDLGLVLDQNPQHALLWEPEFDDLATRLFEITESFRNSQDDYDTSLGKAFCLAGQATELARRVVAIAPGPDRVDQPIDPDSIETADAVEFVDDLIDVSIAARTWERGPSWWREQVGEGKPIRLRDWRGQAKLFSHADAEALARQRSIPRR